MRLNSNEELCYFFKKIYFDAAAPAGRRVQAGACQNYTPKGIPGDPNYSTGASAFRVAQLTNGLDSCYTQRAAWRDDHRSHFLVSEVESIDAPTILVNHTPDECDWDDLKPAHASMVGITKASRGKFLVLLENKVAPVAIILP